ncbi:hypothetical protein [Sphingobacterium siyangense]|uniref:hypothetical protein n=1 Tax=Sphingobacterium siyangense TaxID=459529 RepID=UPI002FD8B0CF
MNLALHAQEQTEPCSYVVTRTNDTIYGHIKAHFFTGNLKLVTLEATYNVDPNCYASYYNARQKELYRSKMLSGPIPAKIAKRIAIAPKSSWLRCIEDGKIALYEHKYYIYGQTPDIYSNFLNFSQHFFDVFSLALR